MYEIKCDTHTHTLYSRHAFSTIAENVKEATDTGLELLGSTDHFSAMLWPDVENAKNYQYLANAPATWPRTPPLCCRPPLTRPPTTAPSTVCR